LRPDVGHLYKVGDNRGGPEPDPSTYRTERVLLVGRDRYRLGKRNWGHHIGLICDGSRVKAAVGVGVLEVEGGDPGVRRGLGLPFPDG
jgi:hypothetical protein